MHSLRVVLCLLASLSLSAQEYRANLLGVVSDSTGSSIPGATVRATNIETGVATSSVTNSDGSFLVPFLNPGRYSLLVEMSGFKSVERSPIELRVNDRTRVDVLLEVGQLTDRVTVVAEAPLLEVSTASRGQSIENRKITDLPLAGRNPFGFTNLAAGVQYTGSLAGFGPTDSGAMSSYSINGGRPGQNAFLIDGMSDQAITTVSNLAYVPPIEATGELKIQTNTYDAQYGRTSGGVMSLSVKPGTNTFHGAAYEYLRRTPFEANTYANNATGVPRTQRINDQYGFEIDGPVTIPRLYKGRDKTFFMFAFEGIRSRSPASSLGAVPTPEQKQGDFSQTLSSAGRPFTMYDPLTIQPNPAFDPARAVTLTNLQFIRTPFPNNRIPQGRMNPIALRVLNDIPAPNQPGDPITKLNNWYKGDIRSELDYSNYITRVDHNINSSWKIFGRWNYNYRNGGRINYDGWDSPARRATHLTRRNDGAGIDAVGTLSPRSILSMRAGFNRFKEESLFTPADVSSLGFPAKLAGQLQIPDKYPIFTFENYLQTGNNETAILPSETFSAQANMLHTIGTHSFKYGFEYRHMRYASIGRANGQGTYGFTRSWTSSNPQINDANGGNAIASFLLGYMNSASAVLNSTPYLVSRYPVLFFHDDWQVTRRLTLNLGFRWDLEGPPVERYNDQNRGFDYTAQNPYQVPGLNLRGGLLFAGVNGLPRGAFDTDKNNFQPRFGLAYKMLRDKPLVFRGGAGLYYLPTVDYGGVIGFSQTTSAQTTTPGFLPFHTLGDPFPNGLIPRPGASQGLRTQVGDSVSFNDSKRVVPKVWQYSAGFQYELVPGILVEATYVGSQTLDLQVSRSISYLTNEQLALGTPFLSQVVPNPFFGVLPVTTSRGAQATIQRRNLLTQYPHYSGLTANQLNLGASWYNSVQFKLEQRFKHGLTYLVSYTVSKTMEEAQFRNPQDSFLSRELTTFDTPQRLVLSGYYEFPIGPKKKWLSQGLVSHLIGGWQFNWIGVLQSGTPMSYPDFNINGNPKLDGGQTLNRWFNTDRSLWVQRAADSLRTAPFRSPNIRRHTAPNLDLSLNRDFHIREGHRFQLKVSAFNATNTPIFNFPQTDPNSPLFGVVPITQLNPARSVEIGFRYFF
ncbi:MAG: carboxypeptidase regulatory-like domain-containing protein [Bryobacterales bacterium]|nr:carboxypeptidase regulatory-like domain-containing protein [Bryobacterales bacterium]